MLWVVNVKLMATSSRATAPSGSAASAAICVPVIWRTPSSASAGPPTSEAAPVVRPNARVGSSGEPLAPVTPVVTTTRCLVRGASGTVGSSAIPASVTDATSSAGPSSRITPPTASGLASAGSTWNTRTVSPTTTESGSSTPVASGSRGFDAPIAIGATVEKPSSWFSDAIGSDGSGPSFSSMSPSPSRSTSSTGALSVPSGLGAPVSRSMNSRSFGNGMSPLRGSKLASGAAAAVAAVSSASRLPSKS